MNTQVKHHVKMEIETGVTKSRNARQPPRVRGTHREKILHQSFQEKPTANTLILSFSLQNHELIHFCCFKPSSLCYKSNTYIYIHIYVCIYSCLDSFPFSSVQSLSHVWLFATPWTAANQSSLSITNSQSLLELMSIESVMPSNHLILSPPSAFNLSQHRGLFQWVSSLHQVAKVLKRLLQHQSFQWIFRTDFL